MTFSSIFAQFVAFVGGIALQWRKLTGTEPAPAWGQTPAIPEAKPQGAIPTLKMPTVCGWSEGQKPTADELLYQVTGERLELAAVGDRVREALAAT